MLFSWKSMDMALHRVAQTFAVSNTVRPAWRKINKKIFGQEWKLFRKSEIETVRFNDEFLMECRSIYLRNYIDACRAFLNNEWSAGGSGENGEPIRLRSRRSAFAYGSVLFQHRLSLSWPRPPATTERPRRNGIATERGAAPTKLNDRLTPNLNRAIHRHRTRRSISACCRGAYRTRLIFARDIAVRRPDTPDRRSISRLAVSCKERVRSIFGGIFHLIGPLPGPHEDSAMTKPDSLKGEIKGQAQDADRHNLARPAVNGALWARGLTTQRVADLFRTLPGLPGHWMQLQNEVNAGNRYFYGVQNGHQTTDEGKELIRWIADAVVGAAQKAGFDFPLQQLRFTADTGWLKLQRVSGRVMVLSRP